MRIWLYPVVLSDWYNEGGEDEWLLNAVMDRVGITGQVPFLPLTCWVASV